MKKILIFLFEASILAVFAFSFLFIQSCSIYEQVQIDIPSAYTECKSRAENPLTSCKIKILDSNNSIITFQADVNSSPISIFTIKNKITPVLIEFSTSNSLKKEYSGFIYPLETKFSIHGGFCAFIYFKLINSSFQKTDKTSDYLSYFNWNKFLTKIKTFDNPFNLDTDKICMDIAYGKFSTYSLR